MGSGLILLVIVGAWLAVLVPMGLRSHEGAVSSEPVPGAAERLGEAVRVLTRRSPDEPSVAPELAYDPGPRRLPHAVLRDLWTGVGDRRRAGRELRGPRAPRPAASPAARRRRVLLALLLVSVGGAAGGLAGSTWLLGVGGVAAVLAVLFVLHCRRLTWRRVRHRQADGHGLGGWEQDLPASVEVPTVEVPTVEVKRVEVQLYDLTVDEPEPVAPAPRVVAAAAAPRRRPVAAALGAPWKPVPVPPPMYVGKAVAPRRRPAAEPAAWSDDLYAGAPEQEQPVALPDRRAVGDW